MKQHLKIIAIAAATTLLIAGCSKKNNSNDHAMASQLFQKSANLIQLYTDSVKNSTDSAMLKRMSVEFDERIAKINFQFPSDIDLQLTEEENDSLIKLMDKLVAEFRIKERLFNTTLAMDSLSTDSIPVLLVRRPVSENPQ